MKEKGGKRERERAHERERERAHARQHGDDSHEETERSPFVGRVPKKYAFHSH